MQSGVLPLQQSSAVQQSRSCRLRTTARATTRATRAVCKDHDQSSVACGTTAVSCALAKDSRVDFTRWLKGARARLCRHKDGASSGETSVDRNLIKLSCHRPKKAICTPARSRVHSDARAAALHRRAYVIAAI